MFGVCISQTCIDNDIIVYIYSAYKTIKYSLGRYIIQIICLY